MRLISICPSNTELVAYLGLTDSLIAIDDYSDWPEHIKDLPRLGPDLSIDLQKVEELKPDLVLASLSVPGMEQNIAGLKERGIPYVVVPNPKSLSEIIDSLLFVGEATNSSERARQLAKKFSEILKQYEQLTEQIVTPKSIYWEWWPKPIFTPGKTNWITEISRLAGGRNIFADVPEASVKTEWTEVIKKKPDVICLIWVGVHKEKVNVKVVEKREGAENLSALKENKLYVLEEPLFCRPSPRLLVGLMKIAYLLHPDVYPPYDEGYDPLIELVCN
ncbi:cobalamin-binding protein [Metabacillus malikii]|uniref:Iron complex transport system substrate-binding protein n=1 Tax=Metabacillus malikii TaxID=1504265 RepID=A0ABT9Z9S0_9BACI|nr:cobalamin-binding protein [Metabacillus malikii]MDQ0228998.1 iron complex transport system substrate-binding protein [Metabacillus malikii]